MRWHPNDDTVLVCSSRQVTMYLSDYGYQALTVLRISRAVKMI